MKIGFPTNQVQKLFISLIRVLAILDPLHFGSCEVAAGQQIIKDPKVKIQSIHEEGSMSV